MANLQNRHVAMLFCDIVRNSDIKVEQQKLYLKTLITRYLNIASNRKGFIFAKDLGDGLLVCMDECVQLAEYTLEFRDVFRNTAWLRLGFLRPIEMRFGLEFALITLHMDGSGHVVEVSGTGVDRAARIEPVTRPNQASCTRLFADTLVAEHCENILCDPLGPVELPKGAGRASLFHLRWVHESPPDFLSSITGAPTGGAAQARGIPPQPAAASRPPPAAATPPRIIEQISGGTWRVWSGRALFAIAALFAVGVLGLFSQNIYTAQHRYGPDQAPFEGGSFHRYFVDSPLLRIVRKYSAMQNLEFLIREPPRRQIIDAYNIDSVEVTNSSFRKFLELPGNQSIETPKFWKDARFSAPNQPVVGVGWKTADAYCRAYGKHLPSGGEWERAARGTDARLYPWGNAFNSAYANTGEGPRLAPAPVGTYPMDRSADGVFDMAGNVSEWTAEDQQLSDGSAGKVVRGGSWRKSGEIYGLTFLKTVADPEVRADDIGFRCVANAAPQSTDQFPMIAIKAGAFESGSEDNPLLNIARKYDLSSNAIRNLVSRRPELVKFREFAIDRYEVSNRQYSAFLSSHKVVSDLPFSDLPATKKTYDPKSDIAENVRYKKPDQPVVGVDWYDARAYCRWRGGRLPTSDEWERAAGGFDGLAYPWGQTFEPDRCNTADSDNGQGGPAAVSSFSRCAAGNGVLNLVGNVDEWTASNASDGLDGSRKVIRGGSWAEPGELRGFNGFESWADPGYRGPELGFRCAADPSQSWVERFLAMMR